jgi:hypothetical protein
MPFRESPTQRTCGYEGAPPTRVVLTDQISSSTWPFSLKSQSNKVQRVWVTTRSFELQVCHCEKWFQKLNKKEKHSGLLNNITQDTNVTKLEDTMHSDNRMNQSLFLRAKNSPHNAEGLSTIRWSDISRCFESANAFVCAPRAKTASHIGREIGRGLAPPPAGLKMMSGALPCVTERSGAGVSKLGRLG